MKRLQPLRKRSSIYFIIIELLKFLPIWHLQNEFDFKISKEKSCSVCFDEI